MTLADSGSRAEDWIALSKRNGVRVRLFCLPHAGSGTAMFNMWQRSLPSFVDIARILLPGREVRIAEPCSTEGAAVIEQVASAVAEHLDLPYAIFGHSMGAWLASELAQSLAAKGLRPPGHVFVSGRNAAHRPPHVSHLHELPDDEFLAALSKRYNAMPKEVLESRELVELYLPILRADMTMIERHTYGMRHRLDCPVSAFAGEQDGNVSNERLLEWQELTTGPFELRRFEGDHFYLTGASKPLLLDHISERLVALDTTQGEK